MERIIREENTRSERGKKQPNPQCDPEMQQLNYNLNLSHEIMGERITPLYKFGIK
jgi:hypothetical protein